MSAETDEVDRMIAVMRKKDLTQPDGMRQLCSLMTNFVIAKPDHTTRFQLVQILSMVLVSMVQAAEVLDRKTRKKDTLRPIEDLSGPIAANLSSFIEKLSPADVSRYLLQRLKPIWRLSQELYGHRHDGYASIVDDTNVTPEEDAYARGYEAGVQTCERELTQALAITLSDTRPLQNPLREEPDQAF